LRVAGPLAAAAGRKVAEFEGRIHRSLMEFGFSRHSVTEARGGLIVAARNTAIFSASLYALLWSKNLLGNSGYRFHVLLPSCPSLKVGDPVRLRGYEVGSVRSISLQPDCVVVEVAVRDKNIEVQEASRFASDRTGLTGSPVFNIDPYVEGVTDESMAGIVLPQAIIRSGVNGLGLDELMNLTIRIMRSEPPPDVAVFRDTFRMRLHGKTALDQGSFISPPMGTYSAPDDPTLLLRRATERVEIKAMEEERRQSSDAKVRERVQLARERMALARKQLSSLRSQRNRGISFSFKRLHRRRRSFPKAPPDPYAEQWYLDPEDPGRKESGWVPALPAALLPLRKALRRRAAQARGPPTFDWDADLVPLDLVAPPVHVRAGAVAAREAGDAPDSKDPAQQRPGRIWGRRRAATPREGKAWTGLSLLPRQWNPFAARVPAAPDDEDVEGGEAHALDGGSAAVSPGKPVRRSWAFPFSATRGGGRNGGA